MSGFSWVRDIIDGQHDRSNLYRSAIRSGIQNIEDLYTSGKIVFPADAALMGNYEYGPVGELSTGEFQQLYEGRYDPPSPPDEPGWTFASTPCPSGALYSMVGCCTPHRGRELTGLGLRWDTYTPSRLSFDDILAGPPKVAPYDHITLNVPEEPTLIEDWPVPELVECKECECPG